MEPTYAHQGIEDDIYHRWEASGLFQAGRDEQTRKKKPFTIIMPPPNANGELHLGHVTFVAIEDIMIRYKRLRGYDTLWLPGTDHAGIQTQVTVERELEKQGKTRFDLGRDAFVQYTMEFTQKNKLHITQQFRRIGASCDWSREKFTLDPDVSQSVLETFVKMYRDGLLYRGERIIHWCPRCATGLSDIEVDHTPTKGTLYTIRYPIDGEGVNRDDKKSYDLRVATTRPETLLGDTAVAVHPDDTRYADLIGKNAIVPLVNRPVPIIADTHIDPAFGTGAVKVTPAHDPADFEIGKRHTLPTINVITKAGVIDLPGTTYHGLSIADARKKVLADLENVGLLISQEEIDQSISACERCDTTIEPLISEQWFVKIAPLAEKAIAAVKSGEVKIIPERFEKVFFHWMENIHDWNISRQIWWGHRIPAWTCEQGHISVAIDEPRACETKGCTASSFTQDPDTLDTWFSSGQWPYTTLGFPGGEDFLRYYSTDVMETGWDILTFWVSRMIMLGIYRTGKVPFRTVYLNGLGLDEQGRKMSKSRGNGIDPALMSDRYGTDAMRHAIVSGAEAGQDFRLYEEKIKGSRNFVNKLWNVGRYIITQSWEVHATQPTLVDRWIEARRAALVTRVTDLLDQWKIAEALAEIQTFVWDDLADWGIELSKISSSTGTQQVLKRALESSLTLLHPYMPFVTERIWTEMGKEDLLMGSTWPEVGTTEISDQPVMHEMMMLQEVVRAVRNVRSTYRIPYSTPFDIAVDAKSSVDLLSVAKLTKTVVGDFDAGTMITRPVLGGSISLGIKPVIDLAAERATAEHKLKDITAYIASTDKKLSVPAFLEKAKPEVIEEMRRKRAEAETTRVELVQQIKELTA